MATFKYLILVILLHSWLYAGDFDALIISFKFMCLGVIIIMCVFILQAIEIAKAKRKRIELCKKIPLFNISDIGRKYVALGIVEFGANHQDIAVVKCLEQAQKMGASAIVNFQLATSTNVYSDKMFNENKIKSDTSYFYTGTAIKYKD